MKKKKHYDFYLQCMETGWLPNRYRLELTGLCGAADYGQINGNLLRLFKPISENDEELIDNNQSTGWWGYEGNSWDDYVREREYGFTTLRQTIVLFMACMAGEKF